MVEETLEDLKKLSPKERIKKLKELTEARKTEIDKIEDLIKESESEMKKNDSDSGSPAPEEDSNIATIVYDEQEEESQTVQNSVLLDDQTHPALYMQASVGQDYESIEEQKTEILDQKGLLIDKSKYRNSADEMSKIAVLHKEVKYQSTHYKGIND